MKYLLDTDFLSATSKRTPDRRALDWLRRNDGEATLCTVTLAEFAHGLAHAPDDETRKNLTLFLAEVRSTYTEDLLTITEAVLLEWKELIAELKAANRTIGCEDSLIAACARAHQLTVVTANTRHFEAAGVRCLNPLVK
ncbi:MAG: PilT protein domain-containing protein [Limisphaerales bacterium]|nr:MAG: PilT protein domain-containing protein [Limisphaerales bacterium]KAG0510499.1 MAG: PilT protein domain-containing protein [Limisphaerales bacterium]TXT52772.1 MAG: PilT protein domain-containing protein [Limisphaerales bacterium]